MDLPHKWSDQANRVIRLGGLGMTRYHIHNNTISNYIVLTKKKNQP